MATRLMWTKLSGLFAKLLTRVDICNDNMLIFLFFSYPFPYLLNKSAKWQCGCYTVL